MSRAVLAIAFAVFVGLVVTPLEAFGFNGSGAAGYSNTWALSYNSNYPNYSSHGDCANFVSQSLHSGGGYPYHYKGTFAGYAWWCRWTPTWWGGYFDNSNSWSVANDLRNYLLADYPGGWDWGLQPTGTPNNNALYGDVLFYDWEGDGFYDHAAVEAAYWSVDPAKTYYKGNVVNQHTTNRHHAMWDLWAYNDHRWTTKVDLIHVDSGN